MKKVFLVLFLFFTSCVPKSPSEEASGNLVVKIPWYDSDCGQYALQEVVLSQIQSLKYMTGGFARFFFSPGIEAGRLRGINPQTNFLKNQKGVYIAKDQTSLEMATLYAVMEQMASLDKNVGAAGVNSYPRDIGINAIKIEGGRTVRNNAFYDGNTDAILILNFVQPELPIAFNVGIIAHEHFHSLFNKLVLKKIVSDKKINLRLKYSPHDTRNLPQNVLGVHEISQDEKQLKDLTEIELNKNYLDVFLRGLNEGWADYWAFVFTGDPNFISYSLPSERSRRSLNAAREDSGEKFVFKLNEIRREIADHFEKSLHLDEDLVALSYSIGTSYSRFLKLLTVTLEKSRILTPVESRILVAKALIKTMDELQNQVRSLGPADPLRPDFILQSLFRQIPGEIKLAECEVFRDYLKALLDVNDPSKSDFDVHGELNDWICEPKGLTFSLKLISDKSKPAKNL